MATTKLSFFARIKAFFVKFFTDAPAWDKVALGAIGVIAPLVETALSLAGDSPVAAEVAALVSKIKADLATASVVLEDAGSSATVSRILTSITTNLGSILAAVQIKDPANVAKIETGVTLITQEIEAILAEIPAVAPKASAPVASTPAVA